MGDRNQSQFFAQHRALFHAPVLEVGSRDYGNTQPLRAHFTVQETYIGVDLAAGDGVDCVLDLAGDFATIDTALGGRRFASIICLSVLEHCQNPFHMADNLTRLLTEGGRIYISVPFAWQYHGYPNDYWRFSHHGVKLLFPGLSFDPQTMCWATSRQGKFYPLDDEVGKIALSSRAHARQGHPWRGLLASLLGRLGRLGLLAWLFGYRYVLAPTSVLMIGEKKM